MGVEDRGGQGRLVAGPAQLQAELRIPLAPVVRDQPPQCDQAEDLPIRLACRHEAARLLRDRALKARNRNFASSGSPFTAFRAAKSVGVSTPLRGARVCAHGYGGVYR
ncbi:MULTISPECIES: hypothetical protein [unclassified Microbispora]|uniref:hypothetical protein n=1 Tax=unclassified Microbispora TaxID=2614687 RepID=UPI0016013B79|nr:MULTISPECIES: hypothetical protein [unclassified Microbispora]